MSKHPCENGCLLDHCVPLTYQQATDLAIKHAQSMSLNGNAPSYLKDAHLSSWTPHAWVVETIIEASVGGASSEGQIRSAFLAGLECSETLVQYV